MVKRIGFVLLAWVLMPMDCEARSWAARAAFQRAHPCPATQSPRGPCPGWILDHIKALACGGADAPDNMQWQTVAEARAKDRWERVGCDGRRR